MSRRTTTPTSATSAKYTSPTMKTDLDDWETDPDFVSDFGEMEQRWGNKRTVGSINMNELIDDVRREHQKLRDKFSESFKNFDHHEEVSKRVVQETRKEVFSSKENVSGGDGVKDVKRTVFEKNIVRDSSAPRTTTSSTSTTKLPPVAPKPDFSKHDFTSRLSTETTSKRNASDHLRGDDFRDIDDVDEPRWRPSTTSPNKFAEESSSFKRYFNEEKSSSSSSLGRGKSSGDLPPAFKSIQDKIDAFKKEFEDIDSKVSKKSDLSKVIKKTTNVEKKSSSKSNLEHVSRYGESDSIKPKESPYSSHTSATQSDSTRPASSSPLGRNQASKRNNEFLPKSTNNIKSLSEKFETLCREDEDDFKRRTEAKRREFFDQIKHQVRETRKGLDGFDPIDDDDEVDRFERVHSATPTSSRLYSSTATKSPTAAPSPKSPPSSYLSSSSIGKPKVYTRSETTKEEVISRVVKENDKVVQNETKRNVERKSSCHGSSDEDAGEPTSIKYLNEKMGSSPQQRTVSPIDELKRKVPVVEPEVKGGGLMARALFDYNAAEEDELTFDVDDLITNIEKVDPGWYKGTMTKGGQKKIGLFPANHVKLLNDDGEY